MDHTTAKKAASTLLSVSILLGSFPAIAGEGKENAQPSLQASHEPAVCDWLVTKDLLAHQARWECWEPATGYVRTAISATSVDNREGNELQSAFYAVRSSLKVAFSRREWPWSERVGMLDVVPDSLQTQAGSR